MRGGQAVTIKVKGNKHLKAHAAGRGKRKAAAAKNGRPVGIAKSVLATVRPVVLLPRRLYWAYGSNLNHEQMSKRCPAATPVKALYLGGQLVFRYVADVVGSDDPRALVAGGLWWVTPECEAVLDGYEGVNAGSYAKKYFDLKHDGKVRKVLYYQMCHGGISEPPRQYLDGIVQGYRDFGLNLELLREALEHAVTMRDKTPELRARHIRSGKPPLARIEGGMALDR
jgi:hypothetical protein